MPSTPNIATCLSCGRSEHDFPVLMLRLAGREANICPQCLPALIHHPDRLTDKLIAEGWNAAGQKKSDEQA